MEHAHYGLLSAVQSCLFVDFLSSLVLRLLARFPYCSHDKMALHSVAGKCHTRGQYREQ